MWANAKSFQALKQKIFTLGLGKDGWNGRIWMGFLDMWTRSIYDVMRLDGYTCVVGGSINTGLIHWESIERRKLRSELWRYVPNYGRRERGRGNRIRWLETGGQAGEPSWKAWEEAEAPFCLGDSGPWDPGVMWSSSVLRLHQWVCLNSCLVFSCFSISYVSFLHHLLLTVTFLTVPCPLFFQLPHPILLSSLIYG